MFLLDGNFFHIIRTFTCLLVKFKCIIKETLSHKTAWDCWVLLLHRLLIQIHLLICPKIFNLYDWVTGTRERCHCLVLSIELLVITRLHISSMVLVEIIQLIVDVDWPSNTWLRDVFEIYLASL